MHTIQVQPVTPENLQNFALHTRSGELGDSRMSSGVVLHACLCACVGETETVELICYCMKSIVMKVYVHHGELRQHHPLSGATTVEWFLPVSP